MMHPLTKKQANLTQTIISSTVFVVVVVAVIVVHRAMIILPSSISFLELGPAKSFSGHFFHMGSYVTFHEKMNDVMNANQTYEPKQYITQGDNFKIFCANIFRFVTQTSCS